jgi:hypothetical protein
MSHRKQPSKRILAPALEAAGFSLSLPGGVSAAHATPAAEASTRNTAVGRVITLCEEEISDVSLATHYLFDSERVRTFRTGGIKFAGCGGCGCGQGSDIRLKREIRQVGEFADGINLYRYRYLWSDTIYVGVMAQEVAEVRPEAVLRGADGYLRVDYARLGLRLKTWEQWAAAQ